MEASFRDAGSSRGETPDSAAGRRAPGSSLADEIPHPGREFSHAVDVKNGEHDVAGQMIIDQHESVVLALLGQVDERTSDGVLAYRCDQAQAVLLGAPRP